MTIYIMENMPLVSIQESLSLILASQPLFKAKIVDEQGQVCSFEINDNVWLGIEIINKHMVFSIPRIIGFADHLEQTTTAIHSSQRYNWETPQEFGTIHRIRIIAFNLRIIAFNQQHQSSTTNNQINLFFKIRKQLESTQSIDLAHSV